jgi:DNA-binding NarL/FixJ family response regulator
MRTETLETLYLEEIRDIRGVKQQISEALARIAKGVSAESLGQALMKLLETTEHVVERSTSRAREILPSNYSRLTSREAEVLRLIAEGYANKQIAAELEISIKTVEKHRQHLMAKLDLHDTAGVTRYAVSAGVVAATA